MRFLVSGLVPSQLWRLTSRIWHSPPGLGGMPRNFGGARSRRCTSRSKIGQLTVERDFFARRMRPSLVVEERATQAAPLPADRRLALVAINERSAIRSAHLPDQAQRHIDSPFAEPPSDAIAPGRHRRAVGQRLLRRKAALARQAATVPTTGSGRVDRLLVVLAEQLERDASILESRAGAQRGLTVPVRVSRRHSGREPKRRSPERVAYPFH
jgi:hypothetical protein